MFFVVLLSIVELWKNIEELDDLGLVRAEELGGLEHADTKELGDLGLAVMDLVEDFEREDVDSVHGR